VSLLGEMEERAVSLLGEMEERASASMAGPTL
jgi:hypothetical protein